MASDMKAVITLTADASGVQAGIDRAMGGLNKMANAVQAFRGGMAGQMLTGVFDFAKNSFDQYSQQITDAAHTYGPLSHSTQVDQAMAQEDSMRKLGQAFDPFVALIDGINTQGIKDITDYLIANKEAIGQAMVNIAEFGYALGQVAVQAAVGFAEAINHVAEGVNFALDVFDNPASTLADTSVGVVNATLGQDAAMWLQGIYNRLGGN